MQKNKYLFICFILGLSLFSSPLSAQENNKQTIIRVIDNFFVAMSAKDTNSLDSLMHNNCMIYSTLYEEKGKIKNEVLHKSSLMGFMRRAIKKKYTYQEKLWSYDVTIEDNMATVWTEYTLFVGKQLDQVSHCGSNTFQLIRNPKRQWQIVSVVDTRRKENCIEKQSAETHTSAINLLMDNWHKAAATADAEAFFGAMTVDGIYLGTDASERWLRDELRKWSKFAFERESAWAFTASKRQIYFADNQQTAWFEESLDTWMGQCRGSGVLVKIEGEWKIKHYDLSIMVPNDLVNCFIALVEKGVCKKKRKK